MNMLICSLVLTLIQPLAAIAADFQAPPEGFFLVAEDDCGDPELSLHVTQGKTYVFDAGMVSGPLCDRDIVFDNDRCILRYRDPDPRARYKVDVVYATEPAGKRVQSLEANGHLVHEDLPLPAGKPGRFIFDIPPAAYAEGQHLELAFIRRGGANAVVSFVRIWSSTDKPLAGRPALWTPTGPIERDWLRQDRMRGTPRFEQWEDPAREVRESVLPCVDEQLTRGLNMLRNLERLDTAGLDGSRAELAAVAESRDRLRAAGSVSPQEWLRVYRDARWAVRRLVFKHPLLPRDGLLFVRRHHAHHMHQCARRLDAFTLPGGGICVLDGISADGTPTVRSMTDGLFPRGTFGRPDISFDGRRIVFGFAPERGETGWKSYDPISERTAPVYAEHKVGPCEEFQVWEMPLDGSAPPRQITSGPAENSDPLYLPNGRIAFMSHRAGGLVQCGDWALAYCLYTMNPDGSDLRKITMSKDGEWDPFLLEDGTIGFTRWEYVMKFWSPIQMVWSVRPDGTNPVIIYSSDLSKSYAYPLNYASARQIPGTSKLACIGSAHHNTGAGPLCVVDMARGPKEASGLARLTPVRFVETPDEQPDNGWYDCPWPLDDQYFLVSHSLSAHETDTTGYGLYLYDIYGGRELIYRDEELSALFPMPLGPRRRPIALPDLTDSAQDGYGELLIQDIHDGLAPSARGLARYVQVVECLERHFHTSPYAVEVGPDSGFEAKAVLGTAPVEADGSARLRVPADRSVFFTVLDEDYRALHTMRSVTNLQAGEVTGCVGCHENPRHAPANRRSLASLREPSDLEAPPWGVVPMDYAAVVQPVLDRNCIACHDGSGEKGKAFDLTARTMRQFHGYDLPASYFALRPHVKHAPMFTYHMVAGSFGSRVSPLTEMLLKGHHDVRLSADDWRRICAWIDCNAPGIGSYEVALPGKADVRMNREVRQRRGSEAELEASIAARRQAIAAALPPGARLACYLDCGPVDTAGSDGNAQIRRLVGGAYNWGLGEDTPPPVRDILFEGSAVEFELTGLRADRNYSLGLTWWDVDNGGREQSVQVSAPGVGVAEVLGKTRLPAWSEKQEKWAQLTAEVPPRMAAQSSLTLSVVNRCGTANAVVSELWVIERE